MDIQQQLDGNHNRRDRHTPTLFATAVDMAIANECGPCCQADFDALTADFSVEVLEEAEAFLVGCSPAEREFLADPTDEDFPFIGSTLFYGAMNNPASAILEEVFAGLCGE